MLSKTISRRKISPASATGHRSVVPDGTWCSVVTPSSGRSDGQTPIHEFFHNLGAVDTFVYGTRIMDYNEQVNGEPVPVRKVQMEDIETLINQSNSKLGIVYEN